MNLKKLTIVPMLAMALFAVGCGGADCESVCEDGQECDGADKVDCAKTCEDGEKAAKDAGCEDEWDALWECAGDVDDVCEESDACDKESDALTACALE